MRRKGGDAARGELGRAGGGGPWGAGRAEKKEGFEFGVGGGGRGDRCLQDKESFLTGGSSAARDGRGLEGGAAPAKQMFRRIFNWRYEPIENK